MPHRIIFDTDIGSDIDDAVCLAYLLAQPECDLLGVTTVSGESTKRAMMVDAICQVAGKTDTPIYPGVEQPLLIESLQPTAPQAAKLPNWKHRTDFAEGKALEFLRNTIHANPGEITLLAVGPLTNIGLLFAMDREIPALLKELVIMGGHFQNYFLGAPLGEWNIINDPHAAAIVFNSGVKIRAIGLEVTCQCVMNPTAVRTQFEAPLLQPVKDFAEVWFEKVDRMIFHDPLAALTIFDGQVCAFEQGTASVELISDPLQGFTYWKANGDGNHEVAASVDAQRFFEQFFAVFD